MAVVDVRDPSAPTVAPAAATGGRPRVLGPFSERRGRDPWFDNARLAAALLVVVGHCISAVPGHGGWPEVAWAGSWAFRIPVFVLVAGLFSSAEPLTPRRFGALVRDVALVFVLFDLIELVQAQVNGAPVDGLLVPEFGVWFLLSLFCWRVVLPFVARVPHLFAWAVGAAVLAGFLPSIGEQLSASRTIALFPLFLVGWRLRDLDLHSRPEHRLRRTAAVTAVTVCVVVVALDRLLGLGYDDFLMRSGYHGAAGAQVGDAVARLALLALAAAGSVAVVALVPRRRVRFVSYLGAGSMFIYLLHVVVVNQGVESGWFDRVRSPAAFVAMLALAVGGALALGSPPVRRLTGPLVQPRTARQWSWRRVRSSGAFWTAP